MFGGVRLPPMPFSLEKQLTNLKVPASQRGKIVDILATSPDPGASSVLLKALRVDDSKEVHDQIVANFILSLPGKWSSLRKSKDLADAIQQLLSNKSTRLAAVALIGAAEKADLLHQVIAIAKDAKEPLPVRVAAVQTLGVFKLEPSTMALANDLLKMKPAEIAVEAARSLGRQGTTQAMKPLQEIAGSNKAGLELRQASVSGLAGTRPCTTWLLEAHASEELAKDLLPHRARLPR